MTNDPTCSDLRSPPFLDGRARNFNFSSTTGLTLLRVWKTLRLKRETVNRLDYISEINWRKRLTLAGAPARERDRVR
jgi:hypothetical protein